MITLVLEGQDQVPHYGDLELPPLQTSLTLVGIDPTFSISRHLCLLTTGQKRKHSELHNLISHSGFCNVN